MPVHSVTEFRLAYSVSRKRYQLLATGTIRQVSWYRVKPTGTITALPLPSTSSFMPASVSTHEQFMRELTQLMLREGVSQLTVGEIAARLRCSRRRLYHIAPSKEAIFLKVADQMFRSVRAEGWIAADRERNAAGKFAAYLEAGIAVVRCTTEAFFRELDTLPAARAMIDRHQRERIAGLEKLIDQGIRSGEFVEFHSRVVAEILLSAARRMREPSFSAETGASFEEAFSELSRLALDGLRRRQRGDTRKSVAARREAAK